MGDAAANSCKLSEHEKCGIITNRQAFDEFWLTRVRRRLSRKTPDAEAPATGADTGTADAEAAVGGIDAIDISSAATPTPSKHRRVVVRKPAASAASISAIIGIYCACTHLHRCRCKSL